MPHKGEPLRLSIYKIGLTDYLKGQASVLKIKIIRRKVNTIGAFVPPEAAISTVFSGPRI
jgi:hypothetical protein